MCGMMQKLLSFYLTLTFWTCKAINDFIWNAHALIITVFYFTCVCACSCVCDINRCLPFPLNFSDSSLLGSFSCSKAWRRTEGWMAKSACSVRDSTWTGCCGQLCGRLCQCVMQAFTFLPPALSPTVTSDSVFIPTGKSFPRSKAAFLPRRFLRDRISERRRKILGYTELFIHKMSNELLRDHYKVI